MTTNAALRSTNDSDRRVHNLGLTIRSRLLRIIIVLFFCILSNRPATADGTDLWRERIMATMMFKFVHYIEWPTSTGYRVPETITVGILGEGSIKGVISDFDGRNVDGHTFRVRQLTSSAELDECHVVFVADPVRHSVNAIVDATRNKPVLLVANAQGFAASGGTINFFADDRNRVQFEINVDAAETGGLKISSRLLKLARRIHRNDR